MKCTQDDVVNAPLEEFIWKMDDPGSRFTSDNWMYKIMMTIFPGASKK